MSLSLDLEDCQFPYGYFCDGAYMEYSTDGVSWIKLGAYGQGTNWYNKNYAAASNLWSVENYYRWHVATLPLTVLPAPLTQYTRIQFRFVVSSDASVNRKVLPLMIYIFTTTLTGYMMVQGQAQSLISLL
ncbi:MAG: hypothetical protein IPH18_05960 [Chitinophagaceae bacterium]|nr:hypothetical protein [Chitinophagaceae bacterium]